MKPEEIAEKLKKLEIEVKALRIENAELKSKLGIRQFLKSNANPSKSGNNNMETEQQVNNPVKKPPPFFMNGVKSIASFNTMLNESGVTNHEIKALANGEIKVMLNSSDDYKKCRNFFDQV